MNEEPKAPPNEDEEREIAERSAPEARIVHAAVSKQGEDELSRPTQSLFWSGVGAGFAIMSSVVAQAAIATVANSTAQPVSEAFGEEGEHVEDG